MRRNVRRCVSATLLLAVGVAPALAQKATPDVLAPERERRVLAVLRELDFGGVTAARHTYAWETNAFGTPCLVRPERPIGGSFARSEIERLQAIGEQLAAAYDVDWRPAPAAAVDPDPLLRPFGAFDAHANMGWAIPALEARGIDWVRQDAKLRASDEVSEAWSLAREKGAKVCFLHAVQLLEVEGQAMVAATFVEFLNRATSGADVDLGAVFFAAVQRTPWMPEVGDAETDADGMVRFAVKQPTVLRREVVAEAFELRDVGEPRSGVWERLPQPRSTRGMPTRVQVPLVAKGAGARAMLVVVQGRGRERVTANGEGGVALLDSRFDPVRPFTVLLTLAPGRYELDPHVLVGLPAR